MCIREPSTFIMFYKTTRELRGLHWVVRVWKKAVMKKRDDKQGSYQILADDRIEKSAHKIRVRRGRPMMWMKSDTYVGDNVLGISCSRAVIMQKMQWEPYAWKTVNVCEYYQSVQSSMGPSDVLRSGGDITDLKLSFLQQTIEQPSF